LTEEIPETVQRWTAKRRSALVVSILKGETSVQEARRKHGLTVAEIEDWKEKFLSGAENALRSKPRDEEALKDEQIKRVKQKVGELVLDMDILKEAREGTPFRPGDERRVKEALPHASERRVCRLLEVPRSAMRERPSRPGVSPKVNDFLRGRIEDLIKQHPTYGYRRIWALLRFRHRLKVNKKTVYRILRLKGWFCHQRRHTPRPRARGRISRAGESNERWAMDV